jgi:3-hydroxybutyryl-CoA dehydrogenase
LHGRGVAVDRWAARLETPASLRGRPGEPLERPADRRRRAAPQRRPRRDAVAAETASAISPSSTSPIAPAGGAPGRRSRWRSRERVGAVARARAEWLRDRRLAAADDRRRARARRRAHVAMLVNEAPTPSTRACARRRRRPGDEARRQPPAGPFEFLARWDAVAIAALLDHLDAHYRGERYRVSPACASAPGWRSSARRAA